MKIGKFTPLAMFLISFALIAVGYTQRGESFATMALLAGALMALAGAFATISRGRARKSDAQDLVDPTKGE